jgi:hypothetical protein
MFVTLEDETGWVNVVVRPELLEAERRILLGARLLGVYGQITRQGSVVHLHAKRVVDRSPCSASWPPTAGISTDGGNPGQPAGLNEHAVPAKEHTMPHRLILTLLAALFLLAGCGGMSTIKTSWRDGADTAGPRASSPSSSP